MASLYSGKNHSEITNDIFLLGTYIVGIPSFATLEPCLLIIQEDKENINLINNYAGKYHHFEIPYTKIKNIKITNRANPIKKSTGFLDDAEGKFINGILNVLLLPASYKTRLVLSISSDELNPERFQEQPIGLMYYYLVAITYEYNGIQKELLVETMRNPKHFKNKLKNLIKQNVQQQS